MQEAANIVMSINNHQDKIFNSLLRIIRADLSARALPGRRVCVDPRPV